MEMNGKCIKQICVNRFNKWNVIITISNVKYTHTHSPTNRSDHLMMLNGNAHSTLECNTEDDVDMADLIF